MTSAYVRPGEGRHNPMTDGYHIAKAAVDDAEYDVEPGAS